MSVFSQAVKQTAKAPIKKGTAARNKEAVRLNANRNASSQSLFGPSRQQTRRWNQTSKNMDKDQAMQAFDSANARGKSIGTEIAGIKSQLNDGSGLSKTKRAALENNLTALQNTGASIGKERRAASGVLDGTGSAQVTMTGKEQLLNKGRVAADYMWGGTGKQIAARNGAAAGAIIGTAVGLDALDGSIRD